MTTFVPGNKRTLYFGTQSGIGVPQTTPTRVFRVTDFTPSQIRTLLKLGETDATTQERGNVVVGFTPGFSFKTYLRPSQAAFLYQSLLGADTDSGSTPNYTHTLTPVVGTPYLTMYEDEPGVWCNRHTDIRVTSIQLDGQVGGAAEATVVCEALGFTAGASSPGTPAAGSDLPLVYPELTVTRAGVHAGTASQVSVLIARNGQRAQGDNGFSSLDYVNGLFAVSGQFTKYASDDADQRQVDTGSKTGTTPTAAIYEETLAIKLTRDSNTSINIAIPAATYVSRAAAVDVSGAPLAEVMGFEGDPQSTLAAAVVVTVKDQAATPDA